MLEAWWRTLSRAATYSRALGSSRSDTCHREHSRSCHDHVSHGNHARGGPCAARQRTPPRAAKPRRSALASLMTCLPLQQTSYYGMKISDHCGMSLKRDAPDCYYVVGNLAPWLCNGPCEDLVTVRAVKVEDRLATRTAFWTAHLPMFLINQVS